ncbi:hypothetical protein KY331_00160 [Candidatus Woesearchaeota archaeon]|nr:hypothetical protein [Candidatus Woesearchaeota archaeon]
MKGNRGLFLIFLGILFVLLLSIDSILFRLSSNLFKIELIFFLFFLLFGAYLLVNLYLEKEFVYRYLFLFFIINLINIFYIYFYRFYFKEIALPAVMCLIGLYISAGKLKKDNVEDIDEFESVE